MIYDKEYKDQPNAWGGNVTPIVARAAELVEANTPRAIDAGAGQGRDSLYLAEQGFNVTALDISEVGLNQIKKKNGQIRTVRTDISEYDFDQEYDLVISINMLHFLDKEDIVGVIDNIKRSVAKSGVVAISLLLDNQQIRPYELKNWFKEYDIILYKEFTKQDKPHIGSPHPHTHQIAQLVARKI
jgi:tellurite methyltransferase